MLWTNDVEKLVDSLPNARKPIDYADHLWRRRTTPCNYRCTMKYMSHWNI